MSWFRNREVEELRSRVYSLEMDKSLREMKDRHKREEERATKHTFKVTFKGGSTPLTIEATNFRILKGLVEFVVGNQTVAVINETEYIHINKIPPKS